MTKIRVKDLSGEVLSYWVAKALDFDVRIIDGRAYRKLTEGEKFSYTNLISSDIVPIDNLGESLGSFLKIMEKEKIALAWFEQGWCAQTIYRDNNYNTGAFDARLNPDYPHAYLGKTFIQAVMRCYVASKFGQEVSDDFQSNTEKN